MKILNKIHQAVCQHKNWDIQLISISTGVGVNAPQHKAECKSCGVQGQLTKFASSLKKDPSGMFVSDDMWQTRYSVNELIYSELTPISR